MDAANKMCVVIPVHKAEMTAYEQQSLIACYRHLKNYDCFLVHPGGMDISRYKILNPHLIAKPVSSGWLASVEQYNKMKVNPEFYKLFIHYTFMLTYELDAYIFSSAFAKHHAFEFDFIGAPIFEGFMQASPGARFLGSLNSGFSMRNIQNCLSVLQKIHKAKLQWKFFKFFNSNFSFTRKMMLKLKWKKLQVFEHDHWVAYIKDQYFHEDIFWSELIPVLFPFFKVADMQSACSFSFEVNAEKLFELNHYQLPLGCHAWPKFMNFWESYIEVPEP